MTKGLKNKAGILKATGVILALFLMSCTKQVPGPQGDPGTLGKPGNLKQTVYPPAKLSPASWILNDSNEWEALVYTADLDRSVLEKGEVKLYLEQDGEWCVLPLGKGYIFTQYSIELQGIRLKHSHIHGGTPERPKELTYRLVILSPAQ